MLKNNYLPIFFTAALVSALFCGEVFGAEDARFNSNVLSLCIRLIGQGGDKAGVAAILQGASKQSGEPLDWRDAFNDVREIAALRKQLETENNAVRWHIVADELKALYLDSGLYAESLEHSKKVFERQKTIPRALEVVAAYIASGEYRNALDFIDYLGERFNIDKETAIAFEVVKCRVYLEARMPETARFSVRKISAQSLQTPEFLFSLAKVQAATRQYASSVNTLKRCFELTAPEVLPYVKEETKSCTEFVPVIRSDEFAQAIKTPSVLASGCLACSKKWDNWKRVDSQFSRTAAVKSSSEYRKFTAAGSDKDQYSR
ncbi:hypothetical protein FACS189419_03000 [Planctomycetales bacterium]|nr:hypothetical protein FACS189419_03000 [Planctomycetales bacterium]